MKIFLSRFTPGATGDKVGLNRGDKIKYQCNNGDVIDAIIDSERMSHGMCSNLGYESILVSKNTRGFLDGKKIIWWEGKMETMTELENAASLHDPRYRNN